MARGLRAHFAPALAGRVTRLGEPMATAYMPSDMALQLARLPYESLAVWPAVSPRPEPRMFVVLAGLRARPGVTRPASRLPTLIRSVAGSCSRSIVQGIPL